MAARLLDGWMDLSIGDLCPLRLQPYIAVHHAAVDCSYVKFAFYTVYVFLARAVCLPRGLYVLLMFFSYFLLVQFLTL